MTMSDTPSFTLDDYQDASAPAASVPAPEAPPAQAAVQPPKRGRPPGRTAAREQAREPAREAVRSNVPQGLTRRRRDNVDPYHVPQDIIPEGYEYQWNAVSVTGNTDVVLDKSMGFYENHWRPVPAERHPGLFMPYGTTGQIVRGGVRLEERPKYLSDEARAEQVMAARMQMRVQTESVMGRMAKSLPDGLAAPNAYQRGRFNTDRAMVQIDRSLDIPQAAGNYQLAEHGE